MTMLLLADDHVLFRQGLAALLRHQGHWEIVGEANNGEEAVRLAQQLQPDIAVMDVSMPGMSGIEAAPLIRSASPGTRIVALSMYGDAHYQELMFKAGAAAYVLKSQAISDLVDAIRAVLIGQPFVSPVVIQPGEPCSVRNADLDKRLLSEREIAVLRLLAQGSRTKDVAERLGISAKTVETYRSRLMHKLGIDNLAELVKFAIRAGIASTEI